MYSLYYRDYYGHLIHLCRCESLQDVMLVFRQSFDHYHNLVVTDDSNSDILYDRSHLPLLPVLEDKEKVDWLKEGF